MSTQGALRERGALLEELRQIVQAMRNMAIAETNRLANAQPALAAARDAVMEALARIPAAAASPAAPAGGAACWLVLGTERGFCGAFNERVAAAVRELAERNPAIRVLAAGERLHSVLGALPCSVVPLGGCASLDEADRTLAAWLDALGRESAACGQIWMLHAGESGIVHRRVLPPAAPAPLAPALRYLPDDALRRALLAQALRLELEQGIVESLAQENRARRAQMQHAQDHLDELTGQLRRRYAALRQETITSEQETLMSSLEATVAAAGP